LADRGQRHTKESAMTKWWAPRLAVDTIHQCMLFHGHYGYTDELPFEQRMRDVIGLEIGDGAAEVMKMVVARELMGRESLPYCWCLPYDRNLLASPYTLRGRQRIVSHLSGADRRPESVEGFRNRARLRGMDRRQAGDHGAAWTASRRPRGRHGHQARPERHPRRGPRQLHRLRARRLREAGGLRPGLRRRAAHPAPRAVGPQPGDDLPDRVEAVHVQPDAAPSAGGC